MTDSLTFANELVDEIADGLGLSEQCLDRATAYAKRADFDHPINRSPSAVAAGSVYLAALMVNEKVTQATLSESSDVSRVAIRNAYQDIAQHEGISLRNRRGRGTARARRFGK
jgi:transcription initiation factor TFIIIB Brf1 subunit/transcription initiation factor TFIIB